MMSLSISGFMVVRKREENYDGAGRGVFSSRVPARRGRIYAGIDRMPWFDLDELVYAGAADHEAREMREGIRRANTDTTGINVVGDLEAARGALALLGATGLRNEIVGVYSKRLSDLKGEQRVTLSASSLGIDVVTDSGLSVVRDALFDSEVFGVEWMMRLNENGLFADRVASWEFAEAYAVHSTARGFDPTTLLALDSVDVFSVEG